MEYIINLNQKDVTEIIAEKFNVKTNQVSFLDEPSKIEVRFEKKVAAPEKVIGFIV